MVYRYERRHNNNKSDTEHRSEAERDRDRILHSSAFRRLDGVTQVVSPVDAPISHNRLTHTLKVAQTGASLVRRLQVFQPDEARELQIDPFVVEAASLAHDLGHPPFGHISEQVLNRLFQRHLVFSGFEGNPQSFRIVTKIATRTGDFRGLDLTRATLNAMLKYPWLRGEKPERNRKWGAYIDEEQEFNWARELGPAPETPSVEAKLMDWADDITYAVYDVEDFYKAGLIPLHSLVKLEDERERFADAVLKRWERNGEKIDDGEKQETRRRIHELLAWLDIYDKYNGTREQRARLRTVTASLIDRYMRAVKLKIPSDPKEEYLEFEEGRQNEVKILKELTWVYVIENPGLARQQYGKAHIIEDPFNIFYESISENDIDILPIWCRQEIESNHVDIKDKASVMRLVADAICLLTDNEAIRIHRSLTGMDAGLFYDNAMF